MLEGGVVATPPHPKGANDKPVNFLCIITFTSIRICISTVVYAIVYYARGGVAIPPYPLGANDKPVNVLMYVHM
jgi:hypothetical protein